MKNQLDKKFWVRKKVFVTGDTGFKGAWLAYWLSQLGAFVTGYSLYPTTMPSMYELLDLRDLTSNITGDVRNAKGLLAAIEKAEPDVIFHLAAQPIVSVGYEDPVGTFETNIIGVANLLEACRKIDRPIPVVIVSSDKCYLNDNAGIAFDTEAPLGGYDPYSASKAGTEIVTTAYRASFFNKANSPRIASARAGNVVGGGDWALNRLLPDAYRCFSSGYPLILRHPHSTRPWQHVLEPLSGYLMLAQALEQDDKFTRAWNFGPRDSKQVSVAEIAQLFAQYWGDGAKVEIVDKFEKWEEAKYLDLNCDQTTELLGWTPRITTTDAILWSVEWYKSVLKNTSVESVRKATDEQIKAYTLL